MLRLKYKAKYSTNYILIIDALSDGELQNGKRLDEDLHDLFVARNEQFPRRCIKVSDISAFRTIFEGLEKMCQYGTQPLIHVEAHGDKIKGLKIGRDYLPWSELIKLVTPLNILTKNNCGLVLASCFGAEISKFLQINKPCPFNFVIAPSTKKEAGELRDKMTLFYKELLSSGSFNLALVHIGENFVFFDSSKYFIEDALIYFAGQLVLVGKPAKALREKILSDVKREIGNAEIDIKLLRDEVKKLIASPEDIYTYHAEIFLHGNIPMPYRDFESLLSAAKPLK
ncbi:hypothetical protein [Pseudomonas sp. NFX15]|uniref:hypothetical protein n=1 Tax=Pseudomonas sp. NFX15 TaxID=2816958 RepID=UPI003B8B69A4